MALVTDQEWEEFKVKFNKSYKDADEESMRRDLYVKTKAKIEDHNKKFESGEVTWKMGINQFADLTESEYACGCRGGVRKPPTPDEH